MIGRVTNFLFLSNFRVFNSINAVSFSSLFSNAVAMGASVALNKNLDAAAHFALLTTSTFPVLLNLNARTEFERNAFLTLTGEQPVPVATKKADGIKCALAGIMLTAAISAALNTPENSKAQEALIRSPAPVPICINIPKLQN